MQRLLGAIRRAEFLRGVGRVVDLGGFLAKPSHREAVRPRVRRDTADASAMMAEAMEKSIQTVNADLSRRRRDPRSEPRLV